VRKSTKTEREDIILLFGILQGILIPLMDIMKTMHGQGTITMKRGANMWLALILPM